MCLSTSPRQKAEDQHGLVRPLRSCESFSDDGLEPPDCAAEAENLVALLFGHISSFSAALVSSALTPSTRSNKDGRHKSAARRLLQRATLGPARHYYRYAVAPPARRALPPGVLPEARPRRAAEGRGRLRAQTSSFFWSHHGRILRERDFDAGAELRSDLCAIKLQAPHAIVAMLSP